MNFLVYLKTRLLSDPDESPFFAHVESGTPHFSTRSLIEDRHVQRSRHPSMFSPVSVAEFAGGARGFNCSEFGGSEKLWNQIGPIDERLVWATPIGIIVACLPRMPLHDLKLPKTWWLGL
jgi:hypothetical protein